MNKGISIIIPTYNGGKIFSECLEKIGQQDYSGQVQLIVIDSGSVDGTIELAEKAGALIKKIDRRRFRHAETRNEAVLLADSGNIVFTVQDAVPCSKSWLSDLDRSLCETGVAAVYTDQIPHDDATPYARVEIESISNARGQKAKIQFIESSRAFNEMPYDEAYRTIGLDNVCAIYRKEVLVNTPFPEVDFAEDIAWAFKNMLLGHKVLYQPDIKVKHSHNRSPKYAFNRQIINSYWCAKIMNRVRDDISSLTVGDLMALANEMGRFANRLRSDILDGREAGDITASRSLRVIDGIQKRYSLRNRAKCFLVDKFSRHSRYETLERTKIEQQAEEDVKHVMNVITKTFNLTSDEEIMEVLEQSAANILGRIYGETYASCMLRGKMSSQLDAFISPYMKGV